MLTKLIDTNSRTLFSGLLPCHLEGKSDATPGKLAAGLQMAANPGKHPLAPLPATQRSSSCQPARGTGISQLERVSYRPLLQPWNRLLQERGGRRCGRVAGQPGGCQSRGNWASRNDDLVGHTVPACKTSSRPSLCCEYLAAC